jgi:hypothetical protein
MLSYSMKAQRLNEVKIVGSNAVSRSLGLETRLAPRHSIQLNVGYNSRNWLIDTFKTISTPGSPINKIPVTVASAKISTLSFQAQYRFYFGRTKSISGLYAAINIIYEANLTGYDEYNRKFTDITGYSSNINKFSEAGVGLCIGYKKVLLERWSIDVSYHYNRLKNGILDYNVDEGRVEFQVGYAFNFRKPKQLETEL